MSDATDVAADLDHITHKAVTRPWSGRTSPRDFRILATIIRRIGLTGSRSLTISTDLPSLADDAGLAYCTSIGEALDSLADGGWISWTVGTSSARPEDRIPSTITLHTVDSSGRFQWRDLPNPELKPLYASDHAGNHGYLIVCRVLADGRTRPTADIWKPYTTAYLAKLTGLNVRAVQRAMSKLCLGFRKVKGGWQVNDLDSLCEHGAYAASGDDERTARLAPRRERGRQQTAPETTERDPKTIEVPPTNEEPIMLMNLDTTEPTTPVVPVTVEPVEMTLTPPSPVDMSGLRSRIPTATPVVEPETVTQAEIEAELRARVVDYSAPPTPKVEPPAEEDEESKRFRIENEERLVALALDEYQYYRVQVEVRTTMRLREDGLFLKMSAEEIERAVDEDFDLTPMPFAQYRDRWPTKRIEMVS